MQIQRFLQTISVLCCFFWQLQKACALQCYYCENCDDNEELQELHICDETPVQIIETTTRNILINSESTTTSRPTTTTTNDSIEHLEQSLESEELQYYGDIVNSTIAIENSTDVPAEETDDYDEDDFDYLMRQHNITPTTTKTKKYFQKLFDFVQGRANNNDSSADETITITPAKKNDSIENMQQIWDAEKELYFGYDLNLTSFFINATNSTSEYTVDYDHDDDNITPITTATNESVQKVQQSLGTEKILEYLRNMFNFIMHKVNITIPADEREKLEKELEDFGDQIHLMGNMGSTDSAAEETNELDQDDTDYFMQKHSIKPRQIYQQPVCYMLTALINGSVVINRGCTKLLNEEEEATCAALALPAAAEIMDCEVCDTNACNKLFNEITPSATAAAKNLTICTYFYMLVAIILFIRKI